MKFFVFIGHGQEIEHLLDVGILKLPLPLESIVYIQRTYTPNVFLKTK